MEKLKIKFHWTFLIFASLLIYFKEFGYLFAVFLSVVLHEFGHFFVAEKLGYSLNQITLMPFGASLNGEELYIENKHEILISVAGPLFSLLIAVVVVSLWWLFPVVYNYTDNFVYANVSIFLVNLLPCFPLDGGRILFCLLKKRYSSKTALKVTKNVSFGVIVVLTLFYILSAFKTINYSLGVFVAFLLVALLFNDKKTKYTLKARTFCKQKNLNKGVSVNIKAISDTSTLLELYKILDPDSLNYILVLNKLKGTSQTLKDNEIENILKKYTLDTVLKDIKF